MTPIFAAYEITFLNNQALRRHSHVDSISTKMFELAAALRGNAKRLRIWSLSCSSPVHARPKLKRSVNGHKQ